MAPLFPLINPDPEHRAAEAITRCAFRAACQDPEILGQYPNCAALFARHHVQLDALAPKFEGASLNSPVKRLASRWPLVGWVEAINVTGLTPWLAGISVRRHLALATFELIIVQPMGFSLDWIQRLASTQRTLFRDVNRAKKSMDDVGEILSRADLVSVLNARRQDDDVFSQEFWRLWRTLLRDWLATRPKKQPDTGGQEGADDDDSWAELDSRGKEEFLPILDDEDLSSDDADESHPVVEWRQPAGAPASAEDHFDGDLPEPGPVAKVSPGRPRHAAASRSHLSRFSRASPLYLADREAASFYRQCMDAVRAATDSGSREDAQAALAHALALTSGSHPNAMLELRWGDPEDQVGFPGILTTDRAWLVRPSLLVEDAGGKATDYGQAWLPVDPGIRELLGVAASSTVRGLRVLDLLDPGEAVPAVARETPATPARVRMALLSRLVSSEPYGMQAAQLAAGATLGSSVAPLHYEDICPLHFADVVERSLASMLGRTARRGLPTKLDPSGRLGLGRRRCVDEKQVRAWHRSLSGSRPTSIEERILALSSNLVAGIEASTGCRPGRVEALAERADFCFDTGVLVISDKSSEPEALSRPVPLARSLEPDFRALIGALAQATTESTNEALVSGARLALASQGPLFFAIALLLKGKPWRPELKSVSDDSLVVRNFARHRLNLAAIEFGVPYLERCAIMGRAMARKTILGDCATEPVAAVMLRQREFVERHLAGEGWRPIERAPAPTPPDESPDPVPDFVRCERRHDDMFSAFRERAQARFEEREDAFAREHAATLAQAIRREFPGITISDELEFGAGAGAGPELPRPDDNLVRRLREAVSVATLRTHEGVRAHRLVCSTLRRAMDAGVLPRAHLREMTAGFRWRRGWFAPGQPGACAAMGRLRDWLVTAPPSSPEIGLVLWLLVSAGPRSVGDFLSLLRQGTVITHVPELPGVVYAWWDDGQASDDSRSTRGSTQVRAFNGVAAIALDRFSRQRAAQASCIQDEAGLAQALHEALPPAFRREAPQSTLDNLMAMARLAAALQQEGPMRMVSLGNARITPETPDRILACHAGLRLDRGPARVSPGSEAEALRRKEGLLLRLARILPVDSALPRSELLESVEALASEFKDQPQLGAAAVLVLFARDLLVRGGRKKASLKASTVHNYVIPMGSDFIRAFGEDVTRLESAGWTDCIHRYLDEVDLQVRRSRLEQLEYLHWRLQDALGFPEVDFAGVYRNLPHRDEGSRPGMLSRTEIDLGMHFLQHLGGLLNEAGASPEVVHGHLASELAMLTHAAFGIRTAEVRGITFRDVVADEDDCFIRIRQTPYGKIKTGNARRRVEARPELAATFRQAFVAMRHSAMERLRSDFTASAPAFGSWDQEGAIDRAALFEPVSEALAWAVDGLARPYSFRKSWAQAAFARLACGTDRSVELAVAVQMLGHGSISVTIENYVHDPALLLCRAALPRKEVLAAVAGVCERTVRRAIGAAGGDDPDAVIATLLAKPGYKPGPVGTPPSLPNVADLPAARLEVSHVEEVLRTMDRAGLGLEDAVRVWRLPTAMLEPLAMALRELAQDYRWGVGGGSHERRLPACKRTTTFAELMQWTRGEDTRGVLLELAEEFLLQSRRHRVSTLEIRAAKWGSWVARCPGLKLLPWNLERNGGFLRAGLGHAGHSGISSWPALRWVLAATWVWARASRAAPDGDKAFDSAFGPRDPD